MSACEIGANSAETMERRPRISQRSCIKCKESKGNLLVRNVVYCKLCLLALVRQRFRKSIDEAIQHDDHAPRVLTIAYSGGLGSTVLLDLAMQELFPENARKSRRHRWSNVFVIYVDHSSVSTSDGDTRSDILRVISKYRLAHPIVVPLEEAFGPKEDPSKLPLPSRLSDTQIMYHIDSVKQLKAYLEALPTKTATSASLQLLTRRLLERAAQSCGASHLLLGRSLSGLSMALISSICQGSGFSIAEERQSVTDGLLSVNPLKDLGSKECGAWVWWNGLQVVSNLIRDTQINGGSSISALTRGNFFLLKPNDREFPF